MGIEGGSERVSPMYLASGFGFSDNGMENSCGVMLLTQGGLMRADHDSSDTPSSENYTISIDFDENGDAEVHYKRLFKEYPSNPLVLRNYAQLLQSKGDLFGAEEYYFQATLANPRDGDILSRYAKLVWKLHHDKDRALNYFECATRAAPEDSHVLAAYASFLWEINDDDIDNEHDTKTHSDLTKETEEVTVLQDMDCKGDNGPVTPPLYLAEGFGIGSGKIGGGNADYYYRSMIQENPNSALLLRNYARFLDQYKGDLKGAEEYYSLAILADQDKASSYIKRAVEASPGSSDVRAAYARFLWEMEDDEDEEEEEGSDNHNGVPCFHGAVAARNA